MCNCVTETSYPLPGFIPWKVQSMIPTGKIWVFGNHTKTKIVVNLPLFLFHNLIGQENLESILMSLLK